MKTPQTLTKDPICGITMHAATAIHTKRDVKTHDICGDPCRMEFLSAFDAGMDRQENRLPWMISLPMTMTSHERESHGSP